MRSIIVVSNEQDTFETLRACFPKKYKVDKALSNESCLNSLLERRYDFIFADLGILKGKGGAGDTRTTLRRYWDVYSSVEIIVMCPQKMIRDAVMVVKAGASNYITYPVHCDEVRFVTESANEITIQQSELKYLRGQSWEVDSIDFIRTINPQMKEVFEKARSVAPTKSTVLLTGETGTGKSLLAKLIHLHSNRKDEPFITVHCGAIPDTLLESELFGHEKGAFTGAIKRKLGKFEIAKGGTIFLDEIGTITASAQIRLLHVLQDGTFDRVGGEGTIEADVRVISATNTDLKKISEDGHFRKDLYYRLDVFPIEIPPLRERREDIPFLIDLFLEKYRKSLQKEIRGVHPLIVDAFSNYSWPGNIREMENLIERAFILETSSVLTPESFPSELFDLEALPASVPVNADLTLAEVRRSGLEEIERNYLRELLTRNKGKIKDSAKRAGIGTRQLHKLMKKHNISKKEFKNH